MDRIVSGYLDEPHKYAEWNYWVKLPNKQFDLEAYIQPEKNPKTGETFEKEDMFLYRYPNGKIKTMIFCSNRKGPTPPCDHEFVFPPPMKVDIRIGYLRQMLPHWREIEKNTITFINSFQADSKANQTNEIN